MEDRLHVTTSQRKAGFLYRWTGLSAAGCLVLFVLVPECLGAGVFAPESSADVGLYSVTQGDAPQLVSWDDWQGGIQTKTSADGGARLVAYTEPQSDIRFASNLQPTPPEPAAGGGEVQSMQEAETLGEEPQEEPLQFLRQVTPLLAPGKWQVDYGIRYLLAETQFPAIAGDPPGLVETRIRQRLLTVPLEFRYGLCECTQAFIHAPFGYSNTELAFAGRDESTSTGGIGDVTAGLTYMLRQGNNCRPDIIGTIGVTAPTGNAGSVIASSIFTPQAQLGQGFWAVSGNVLAVHTCDPLVIFYGLGARFRFSRDFTDIFDAFPADTYNVNPGGEYSYQLGVGFAVTSRITLSTALLGSYVVEDRINGDRIELGNLEPIGMRFAATIARPCNIVEPHAYIGMTDDAPDAFFGITWTY